MSTRSRIGVVRDDGKVMSIYCHWDGYPSYVGSMLLNNYKDVDKVVKLIRLGSISCLREEVDIPEGKKHSYDSPLENVTVAYMRDRNDREEDCHPLLNKDEKSFWKGDIEEWGYLYKGGKWYFATSHGKVDGDGNWIPVPDDKRSVYELTKENIKIHGND